MLGRRAFLKRSSGAALLLGTGAAARLPAFAAEAPRLAPELAEGVRNTAILDALPGKKPLIKLSYRPPNYETPVEYFSEIFTPNQAFFVRYHLADIPEVDAARWRLAVGGDGAATPFELDLDRLRRDFEPVEIAAVCMCSGNRRGLFNPHVPGVQWGLGAMGNARWKGARLKDVLARAGLKKETVEIVLDGADSAIIDKTPDFIKSLPVWKALDENTLLAYEMNGAPLPHFNGAPARIVVPGWTATYWMKHVVSITASTKPFDGFWMKSAYRIPKGKFPVVDRFLTQETEVNTPITEMMVNSVITSPRSGGRVAVGQPVEVRGVAWDGGYGIRAVEVSSDGGSSWRTAELGSDHGRFSFRAWSHRFRPRKAGRTEIVAKASNRIGGTQTSELILNPAGYHHNLMPRVSLVVA